MINHWRRLSQWVKAHQGYAASIALLVGFVIDNLTLRRIDYFFENAVLLSYLFVVAGGIFLLQFYESRLERGRVALRVRLWLPLVIQFALGNLFSGFFVFYSRSGSLFRSWPFLVFLLTIMVGNELWQKYYERLVFRVVLLFIALYSFLIYLVPIILGRLADWVFVLSGLLSLGLIGAYAYWLLKFLPTNLIKTRQALIWSIVTVTIVINLFYFTNILPPIPLSLKDAGIYYRVTRTNSGYALSAEKQSWLEELLPYERIHLVPGQTLSAFSSVFAPTTINTDIVHHWQFYDEQAGDWSSQGRIRFPITGGQDIGYRGYSIKERLFPGWWRVDVETVRGQLIGRIKFKIISSAVVPPLKTINY